MMDYDAMWSSKGKGKSFSKSPTTSSVNAYGIELYPLEFEHDHMGIYPLEFLPTTLKATDGPSTASQAASTLQPFEGMLDSGATASAGPQASVERLFQCLQKVDHKATMELNHDKRPYYLGTDQGSGTEHFAKFLSVHSFQGHYAVSRSLPYPILQNFMSHGLMQQCWFQF
jgi:hypothetical protein